MPAKRPPGTKQQLKSNSSAGKKARKTPQRNKAVNEEEFFRSLFSPQLCCCLSPGVETPGSLHCPHPSVARLPPTRNTRYGGPVNARGNRRRCRPGRRRSSGGGLRFL